MRGFETEISSVYTSTAVAGKGQKELALSWRGGRQWLKRKVSFIREAEAWVGAELALGMGFYRPHFCSRGLGNLAPHSQTTSVAVVITGIRRATPNLGSPQGGEVLWAWSWLHTPGPLSVCSPGCPSSDLITPSE